MKALNRFVRAAALDDVESAGLKTVQLDGRVVLLIAHEGTVFAVDNRCPHMGFPLARGSVKNGVLTCHWHHARFELCSGGTFDPFADDVHSYPVKIEGGDVWVDPHAERDEIGYQKQRLGDGLEQNLRLVMGKAVISLIARGAAPKELLAIGGTFGARQRNAGWRDGLTIMTAMGNVLPQLLPEDRPLALYHGMLHVAGNVEGQPPHFALDPLPTEMVTPERLKSWLREFAEVRDRDGIERVVLTAVQTGCNQEQLADMLFAAVTDHYYLDGGHSIDFINKAFELLDLIGWQQAATLLPSVIPGITAGARMEEVSSWRTPVDLIELLEPVFAELLAGKLTPDGIGERRLETEAFTALGNTLLGDDPAAISQALVDALSAGIALSELSLAVSYAAALRVARFHTSNEFNDWIAVLHTLSSANATHRLLKRAPSLEGARAIWHSAMHLYLNRFLNAPTARLPNETSVADLSADADTLLSELLERTDQRQQVEQAAAVCYRYLSLGHDSNRLIEVLARTLLREDGEFHSYQMLEAGLQLHGELKAERPELAPTVLVAVARYLAGHAPTDRATTQTYQIASRLHAGEALAAE
jgi:nitrite reductase/ring-hydroxylating ferredoxin subunit